MSGTPARCRNLFLLTLAVIFAISGCVHPNDEKLIRHFHQNEAKFNELVRLMSDRRDISYASRSEVKYAQSAEDDSPEYERRVTGGNVEPELLSLLRKLGLSDVKVTSRYGLNLQFDWEEGPLNFQSGWKGFFYGTSPSGEEVEDLDSVDFWPDSPGQREYYFRHIKGNWHLFLYVYDF